MSDIPEGATRVMSPTLRFGDGQGWLMNVVICLSCSTVVQDPVLSSGCGALGHPECIGAEMFQSLPFCGKCFSNILTEYANSENDKSVRNGEK